MTSESSRPSSSSAAPQSRGALLARPWPRAPARPAAPSRNLLQSFQIRPPRIRLLSPAHQHSARAIGRHTSSSQRVRSFSNEYHRSPTLQRKIRGAPAQLPPPTGASSSPLLLPPSRRRNQIQCPERLRPEIKYAIIPTITPSSKTYVDSFTRTRDGLRRRQTSLPPALLRSVSLLSPSSPRFFFPLFSLPRILRLSNEFANRKLLTLTVFFIY